MSFTTGQRRQRALGKRDATGPSECVVDNVMVMWAEPIESAEAWCTTQPNRFADSEVEPAVLLLSEYTYCPGDFPRRKPAADRRPPGSGFPPSGPESRAAEPTRVVLQRCRMKHSQRPASEG